MCSQPTPYYNRTWLTVSVAYLTFLVAFVSGLMITGGKPTAYMRDQSSKMMTIPTYYDVSDTLKPVAL